jgi:hypothetical protein
MGRAIINSNLSACLSKEKMEAYSHLTKADLMWLEAMGWIPPHEYLDPCISGGHCGVCEPCSCDFGLFQ